MKFIDLTGQTFDRLNVLQYHGKDKWGCSTWLCQCNCDNKTIKIVNSNNLRKGKSKSCGCLNRQMTSLANKKYNIYDLSGEYGVGYTIDGKEFYFDLEDYDKIKYHCWHINNGYVITNINTVKQSMHRFILDYDGELQIDHFNRIRHDNQKENLRIATNQENSFNKDKYSTNSTGYKGVYWNKSLNKWCAQITLNYKNILLGYFENIKDALDTRLKASEKYFGEFDFNEWVNVF
jgi:hypothetical protein